MQQVLGDVELEDVDKAEYFDIEKIFWWWWSLKTQRER